MSFALITYIHTRILHEYINGKGLRVDVQALRENNFHSIIIY